MQCSAIDCRPSGTAPIKKTNATEEQIDRLKENYSKERPHAGILHELPADLAMRLPMFTGFLLPRNAKPLWQGGNIKNQLPDEKLPQHPYIFALMISVLEENAANVPDNYTRRSAENLMEKRMQYIRLFHECGE